MNLFFAKDSNVKSKNPTVKEKNGKIFNNGLIGIQKYNNGIKESDRYISEDFSVEHNQQV